MGFVWDQLGKHCADAEPSGNAYTNIAYTMPMSWTNTCELLQIIVQLSIIRLWVWRLRTPSGMRKMYFIRRYIPMRSRRIPQIHSYEKISILCWLSIPIILHSRKSTRTMQLWDSFETLKMNAMQLESEFERLAFWIILLPDPSLIPKMHLLSKNKMMYATLYSLDTW